MTDKGPQLKNGVRLRSSVCTTQIIVVRAPTNDGVLTCGGQPMVELDHPGAVDEQQATETVNGSVLGKRYTDDANTLEVLCTKAGDGDLGFAGVALLYLAMTLPLLWLNSWIERRMPIR